MIIITDGDYNEGPDPTTAADAADAAGTIVYVVGVGSNINETFLQDNIATDASHYFGIADYSGLETALQSIAQCQGAADKVGSNVSSYVSPATCDITVNDTQSIQIDGVNAATDGQTVCVDNGDYDENVTIDKPLTLVAVNGPLTSANINGVVEITANDVTVRGFNISGAVSSAPDYAGIYMWANTSGARLEDNILNGGDNTDSRGILFGYNVTDVVVKNNTVEHWASGSYINPAAVGAFTFIYNDFDNNNVGIGSDGINNVVVVLNEFNANTAEAIGMSDSGGSVADVQINKNNFLPAGAGNNVNAYGGVGSGTAIDATGNWWDSEAEGVRTVNTATVDTTSPAGAIFTHR